MVGANSLRFFNIVGGHEDVKLCLGAIIMMIKSPTL